MKLLSLDNYCFSEWWAKSARGETMIVQPKFDGCALGLRYQSGTLVAAFTRRGKDVTRKIELFAISLWNFQKMELQFLKNHLRSVANFMHQIFLELNLKH